ncbi:hypothetical protein SB767_32125, partial [Bacillus sp. SIMBA_069]
GVWPGGIAQSGEGGSFPLAGLSLQILNTDVDGGPAIGAMYHRTDAFFGSGNSSFSALTHDQDGPGRLDMVIKSSNGRPFSLKSFVYL